MTHELKNIVSAYRTAHGKGLKAVLATVVALDGSSYRRPGVRMLILEDEELIGAVSGGCVEKEVVRQAASVFATDVPKVMTYDGRYRLGCEGILYILIEPFRPDDHFLEAFDQAIRERSPLHLSAYFQKEVSERSDLGTLVHFEGVTLPVAAGAHPDRSQQVLEQHLDPCFKLMIVGAEHDAVQLCAFASQMGWEVGIVAHPTEEKHLRDFPGAMELLGVLAEEWDVSGLDGQTALVLMTHSYVKDLQFLLALKEVRVAYLGLLGPFKRREKLLNEFLERSPDIEDRFFDQVYGPAGLNLGGETPQEIAIAILSEILSVIRQKEPISLRDKKGGIHS